MSGREVVLIVGLEEEVRARFSSALAEDGLVTRCAPDGGAALALLSRLRPDLLLVDEVLPGEDGIAWILTLRERVPDFCALVLADRPDGETFDRAYGASAEVVRKSAEGAELRSRVRVSLDARSQRKRAGGLCPRPVEMGPLVGRSRAMDPVHRAVAAATRTDAVVLIRGETGTGKEVVAREIARRSRSGHPFVAINLASVAPTLAESELFGHVKGAFTGSEGARRGCFEQAGAGTVLLDEVGEAPLELQAKLLRVLEDGTFTRVGDEHTTVTNARVIAATNRDLYAWVDEGRFRRDLFYRLRVIEIVMPALRDRPEDFEPLTYYLLDRIAKREDSPTPFVADDVWPEMLGYSWPGNVRELLNALERAMALCEGGVIRWDDLAIGISEGGSGSAPASGTATASAMRLRPAWTRPDGSLLPLAEAEREHIRAALERWDWNESATARALGIDRSKLRRRIALYRIRRVE